MIECAFLCFIVLKPAIDLVCDPYYLNSKLYDWLRYKERITAKENRKYLYAETYEKFMEMIEQCQDIERLKHLRFAYFVTDWTSVNVSEVGLCRSQLLLESTDELSYALPYVARWSADITDISTASSMIGYVTKST